MVLRKEPPPHTLAGDMQTLIESGLGDDTLPVQQRILAMFASAEADVFDGEGNPKIAGGVKFSPDSWEYMGKPNPEKMMLVTMICNTDGREDLRRHSLYAYVEWARTQEILSRVPPDTPGILDMLDKNYRQALAGTANDLLTAARARIAARDGGTATPDNSVAMEPPEFFR